MHNIFSICIQMSAVCVYASFCPLTPPMKKNEIKKNSSYFTNYYCYCYLQSSLLLVPLCPVSTHLLRRKKPQ